MASQRPEDKRRNGSQGGGGSAKGALANADEARLREALLDLCYERGYEDLRLADLLASADLPEEEFHRAYADLEDYFCAVVRGTCDDFGGRAERALADRSDWGERLRVVAKLAVEFVTEDARVTQLIVLDVQRAGERPRLQLEQEIQRLYDLIDEGASDRDADGALSRDTTNAIGGAIFTQVYLALSRGEDIGSELLPRLKGMSCPTWERPPPRAEHQPVEL